MSPAQPSILITDDDRDFRETLGDLFEPRGYRTILAGDGEAALGIVRTQDVDLVLLDMHMPKLSGLETLRLVKQTNARIPCILMSARMDDYLREQAERALVYSVLTKPVSRGELTGAVERALAETYGW
jgi:CheY-like chemotaxis protein